MTHDEAIVFWNFTHSAWPAGSVFRYFARRPRDGAIYAETLDSAEDLRRVCSWADRVGYNSYWMPNPTKTKGKTRCRSTDITHWQWLMIDIDPVDPDHNDPGACARRIHGILEGSLYAQPGAEYKEKLGLPLRINSGRGMQALYPIQARDLSYGWMDRTEYWESGKPSTAPPLVAVTEVDGRVFAPQIASWWLHELRKKLGPSGSYAGCTIDTSCSDLPRVMRIPNTINVKTGKRAEVIGYPSGPVLDPERLAVFVPMTLPDVHPKIVARRWTDFVPHMTVAGRRFLLEGEEEPGRHRQAAAAMLSLLDLGANREQVLAALLYGAKRCRPQLEPKEVFDMVNRRFK